MDYQKLSIKELKSLAEKNNIIGYSKLRKNDLIAVLIENQKKSISSEISSEISSDKQKLPITINKKIDFLTTIQNYKMKEKQELQNQMDDLLIYVKTIKDEFRNFRKSSLEELELIKTELKETKLELKDLKDSFIMKILMKKVGQVPIEQLPIFKNKNKSQVKN